MLKSQMFYNAVVFKAWASISHGVSADAFPPMMFHSGECAPCNIRTTCCNPGQRAATAADNMLQHVATQDSASQQRRADTSASGFSRMNDAPLMCAPINATDDQ